MTKLTFLVEVEVERESGKFASRDEISELVAEEIATAAESASLSGIGVDGNSEYYVQDATTTELDSKGLKAIWKESEARVAAELPSDAVVRAELKKAKATVRSQAAVLESLKRKAAERLKEREKSATQIWYSEGSAFDQSNRIYLPDGKYNRIMFALGDPDLHENLSVERREDGALEIRMDAMGRYDLIVQPNASNSVTVRVLSR